MLFSSPKAAQPNYDKIKFSIINMDNNLIFLFILWTCHLFSFKEPT